MYKFAKEQKHQKPGELTHTCTSETEFRCPTFFSALVCLCVIVLLIFVFVIDLVFRFSFW
jgi:hypothetical protein